MVWPTVKPSVSAGSNSRHVPDDPDRFTVQQASSAPPPYPPLASRASLANPEPPIITSGAMAAATSVLDTPLTPPATTTAAQATYSVFDNFVSLDDLRRKLYRPENLVFATSDGASNYQLFFQTPDGVSGKLYVKSGKLTWGTPSTLCYKLVVFLKDEATLAQFLLHFNKPGQSIDSFYQKACDLGATELKEGLIPVIGFTRKDDTIGCVTSEENQSTVSKAELETLRSRVTTMLGKTFVSDWGVRTTSSH